MKNSYALIDYLRLIFSKVICGQQPALFKFAQACKLVYNILRGEWRRKYNEKKLSLKIPPVAIFSVTQRCNLNCLGCFTKNYRNDRLLSTEELTRVIKKVSAAGTYIFSITGGEPLLINNILPLLGQFKHCIFFFFTNGTLLEEKEIREFKKYKQIIPVLSTEGSTLQTDSRRGEGISLRITQAFRLLKRAHITFGCSVMATHHNLGLITLRDYWKRKRKQGVGFGLIIDYVPFPFNINPAFILSPADIRYKNTMLALRRKDTSLLLFTFPLDDYSMGNHDSASQQPATCGAAGESFIHINAAGYVEPCPFSHYAQDNILHKSYTDILNSDFLRLLRHNLAQQPHHTPQYLSCQCDVKVSSCARQTCANSTEKPLVRLRYFQEQPANRHSAAITGCQKSILLNNKEPLSSFRG